MTHQKFIREYVRVELWEEVPANMWGEVADNDAAIEAAVKFTGDHNLYGAYMERVISEWPNSCRNALTDYQINRKAWLGHAAVAMALRIPEDITRIAWGMLTDEQRILANKEAARFIAAWEADYSKDRSLSKDMGSQMLFGFDTR